MISDYAFKNKRSKELAAKTGEQEQGHGENNKEPLVHVGSRIAAASTIR